MKMFLAVITSIIVVVAIFSLPIVIVFIIDKAVSKYRRKKHPEYFKYWDAAKKLSFERGAEYNARKSRFDYYFKLYSEGLRDGECTDEYYTEQMNYVMSEYKDLCIWFQEEEKKIRELLAKADLYAKEHDLVWGIIYDSKRTQDL
jgi:hypothetical protein